MEVKEIRKGLMIQNVEEDTKKESVIDNDDTTHLKFERFFVCISFNADLEALLKYKTAQRKQI